MCPVLEYYELSAMSCADARVLLADLENERAQVLTVICRPGGDIVVVTPWERPDTRLVLGRVTAELDLAGAN